MLTNRDAGDDDDDDDDDGGGDNDFSDDSNLHHDNTIPVEELVINKESKMNEDGGNND